MSLFHSLINSHSQVKKDIQVLTSKKAWSKLAPAQLIGVFIVGLSVVGVAASMTLVGMNSDNRQKAAFDPYAECGSDSRRITSGTEVGACQCIYVNKVVEPGQPCPLPTKAPSNTPVPTSIAQGATATPSCVASCGYHDLGNGYSPAGYHAVVCVGGTTRTTRYCGSGIGCNGTVCAVPTNTPTRTPTVRSTVRPTSTPLPGCYSGGSYYVPGACTGMSSLRCKSNGAGGYSIQTDEVVCGPGRFSTNTPTRTPTRIPTSTPRPTSGKVVSNISTSDTCVYRGVTYTNGQCISGESKRCTSTGVVTVTSGSCVITSPTSTPIRLSATPTIARDPGRCYLSSTDPGWLPGVCLPGDGLHRRCVLNADGVTADWREEDSTCNTITVRRTATPSPVVLVGNPKVVSGSVSPTTTPKSIVIKKDDKEKIVEVKQNVVCENTTGLSKVPLVGGIWDSACTQTPTSESLKTEGESKTEDDKKTGGPLCFDLPLLGFTGVCSGTKDSSSSDVKVTPIQMNQVLLTSTPSPTQQEWYIEANQCNQLTGCDLNALASTGCQRTRLRYAIYSSFEVCENVRASGIGQDTILIGWVAETDNNDRTTCRRYDQGDSDVPTGVTFYADRESCEATLVPGYVQVYPTATPNIEDCYDAEENTQGAYCRFLATSPDQCQFPTETACQEFIQNACPTDHVPSWEFDFVTCPSPYYEVSAGCVACVSPLRVSDTLYCQTTQFLRGNDWWDQGCLIH